jgi:hypothetical protein
MQVLKRYPKNFKRLAINIFYLNHIGGTIET